MVQLQIDLPEHFLDEEVKCGYTVTKQMKEVWAVELDLLVQVQKICEKYNIKYFADGGTLLGAVRHKGFIPWDNDIDLKMDRENYNKFCSVAKKELHFPYFLQNEDTDYGTLFGCIKIRNSLTTMIIEKQLDRNFFYNQGIWLDIFVYDNVPDNEIDFMNFQKKLIECKEKAYKFRNRAHVDFGERRVFKRLYSKVIKFFKVKNYYYSFYKKMVQKYNKKKTSKFAAMFFRPDRTKGFEKKSYFNNTEYLDFEFLKIPVPSDYNSVLTENYGNWHEFVVGTDLHGDVIIDTDKSYLEYMNKKREEIYD